MMVQDPIVNRELDQLKRGYRDIHAPVHLATRIRTAVAGRGARSHRWISVTAAAAIVAVAWLLPNLLQRQPAVSPGASRPSFSTLAALRPATPAVKTPGLSQLRSVTMPAMSPRPQLKPHPESTKPQTRLHIDDAYLEEKDHAHV